MAEQLSVGKREVFTTASSLASRMGVVAGQTGDPVAIASSQLGKTLDTLAKRKLVQQEENWKNNLKAEALKTITGYANENRYDPSNFMNQASAYSDGIIESAPKAFKAWSKGYLASIITQESNTIIDATWKRDNQEAIMNMYTGNASELNNMLDQINKADSFNHTTLYGENIMPRLSEMHASYEKLWNTLPTNMRGSEMMPLPPDEMLKQWKTALEEGRIKSVVSEMIERAIEVDKERIANGVLVGNEIDGWVGESAVTETLKLIKEGMLDYEMNGFDEFGSNELTGPFTFTDVDNDKRSEISKNIESHADALVNDHKVESAALTHREQSELAENINLATGGGAGALNDTFSLFETETQLDKYISENFVGASENQIKQIKDSWRVAHIVKNEGSVNFSKKGISFTGAADTIVAKAKTAGITITLEEGQLQLANHIAGYGMAGMQEGIPYWDVSKVGFNEKGEPSNELIVLTNMAQQLGYLHPAFHSFINNSHEINIDENPEAIFSLANTVGFINSRSGYVPEDVEKARSWNALLQLSKQLEFLQSAEAGGTVMTKEKLLERYKMQINPDTTTLDEKLEKIDRAISADTNRAKEGVQTVFDGVTFDEAVTNELYDMIDEAAKDNLLWGNLGLTHIKRFFGWTDEGADAISEMISDDWADLNFQLEEMMPVFKDLVMHHLAGHYASPGEIMPSTIKEHWRSAVVGALKEMGNQGWMFSE